MSRRSIESQNPNPLPDAVNPLIDTFFQPDILSLLFGSVLLIALGKAFGRPKGILANAYFGGRIEKMNALRLAQTQREKCKKDSVALFAGNAPMIGWKPHLKTFLTGNPPVLPLPNLNQHTVVLGSTGCGKTTTINNRLLQDAIRRRLPIVVVDPKGDLAQFHAPYADAFGYEIYCLSPGKPYTDRFNILDFLRSFKDSGRAEQAAKTINRNANVGVSKTDPFFGPSGDKLVRSILMLAKASPYPDLLMAKRLLSLPDLTERLRVAFESGKLDPRIENSFQQFLSGEKSDKTIAGIAATASLVFDGFTQDEFLNAFVGESTIPMDFTGQKILFVQPPLDQEDVIMPLLATFIDLFVEINIGGEREDPLLLFLEEFPVGYFPRVERWMALRRSSGLAVFLTAQNISQIRRRYGADDTTTILGNALTQFYFNPNDNETAEMVSKRCGEKEIRHKQVTHSHGKGGNSRSVSEHMYKVPLKSATDINQMEQGEFILFSNGFSSGGKTSIPINLKYTIPQKVLKLDDELKVAWEQLTCPELCERAAIFHKDEEQRLELLKIRAKAANSMLPLANEKTSSSDSLAPALTPHHGALAHQKDEFEDFV